MTRSTILVLAIALIGILSVIVVKQRCTIESLRHEVTAATEVSQAGAPIASVTDVLQLPVTVSATTSAPLAVVAPNRDDQGIRDVLESQVQQLQAELERVKRLVPEPEDASATYIGPGMWATVDPQTRGTTKIVITGEAGGPGNVSTMTIKGWGACSPVDCEWPEVPFYLLDRFDGARLYRRGFAVWDYADGSRTYLLITFEKSGLRIDKVGFRSGKLLTPYSVVERMKRLQ